MANKKLTKREIEVLRLIATGIVSKEAAVILGVTKSAVDFHLANAYDKLGATNRVAALRRAKELGYEIE